MPQMRSRREQVDAHRFITSRMNQALVVANPDSVERPLRRIGVSIFASVMIMVLAFGGFAIAALLGKGNDKPELNSIIIEKGTTAIYVYTYAPNAEERGEDPKLWPVTNFTSALLLLESYNGEPPVQNLKPESLVGYPKGFTVGIEGAPPSPPSKESLLQHEDWNACSLPREEGSVDSHILTELVVKDMPTPQWLGADDWLLAKTAVSGDEVADLYLLWDDRKYPIKDPGVLSAVRLQLSEAVTVTEEVLTTIGDGPDLTAHILDRFGEDSTLTNGDGKVIKYGQPVEVGGVYYVLLDQDGTPQFAEIGETSRRLLQARTDLGFEDAFTVQSSLVTDTGAQASYERDHFPQDIEDQFSFDTDRPAVCSVFDPDAGKEDAGLEIALYSTAPSILTEAAESVELLEDGTVVSNVENQRAHPVLPPGTAALVVSQAFPGQDIEGFSYLVDSLGYRYGLVDQGKTGSTRALLGYGDVDPIGVPHTMLELIPRGPNLDPSEAKKELNPKDAEVPVFESGADEEGESE